MNINYLIKILNKSNTIFEFMNSVFPNTYKKPNTTMYRKYRAICKKYGIYKEFPKGLSGGLATSKRKYIPFLDYIHGNSVLKTSEIKKKLIRDDLKEHMCYECNRKTWNKKKIPLELHHKDGNSNNNSLENITLLCPNCHAQTENYKSKNKINYN